MRISIDSKARVKIGDLSKGGKARTKTALKVLDHDQKWSETLIPLGILDLNQEKLSIYLGKSGETSDFIVDCLWLWWKNNQHHYSQLEELVITLFNCPGSDSSSLNRTSCFVTYVKCDAT